MNLNTVKLLLPVVAVTIQNNSSSTLIPPFLQDLHMPVAAIGTLVSLNPIFALLSRLPVGMAYRHSRARLLIGVGVIVMGITNFLYSFVTGSMSFAIVHAVNGFAYGAVTTLYMAFYVDSLPPEENRNHAMGYYVGILALGYSTGNFFGGLIADHLGYRITFQLAAYLSLLPCFLLARDCSDHGIFSQRHPPDGWSLYFTLRAGGGHELDANWHDPRGLRGMQRGDAPDQRPRGQ
jgi:predicted MFS family arabinose efflux permease